MAIVGATVSAVVLVAAASVMVARSATPTAEATLDTPTLVGESGEALLPTAPSTSSSVPVAVPAPPPPAPPAPQPAAAPRTTPAAPPRDERAATPIVRVGEIRIPRIGLVHAVYEGVTLTVIDQGPGHWPGSAMPGQLGNTVFAGHRTTKSKPFRNIDQLVPGDEMILTTAEGTFTYQMTRQEIVAPKDVWIVDPTPDATMTIFACHPPGSARQRIVVRGALVSTNRA